MSIALPLPTRPFRQPGGSRPLLSQSFTPSIANLPAQLFGADPTFRYALGDYDDSANTLAPWGYGETLLSTQTLPDHVGGQPAQNVHSLGSIAMTGRPDSTIIQWRLARLGGDAADAYADDVAMLEFDIHYEANAIGSDNETGDP